jgi:hypothetical protein
VPTYSSPPASAAETRQKPIAAAVYRNMLPGDFRRLRSRYNPRGSTLVLRNSMLMPAGCTSLTNFTRIGLLQDWNPDGMASEAQTSNKLRIRRVCVPDDQYLYGRACGVTESPKLGAADRVFYATVCMCVCA